MGDEDILICEECADADADAELRECGHVVCEDCFAGACPICDEEERE